MIFSPRARRPYLGTARLGAWLIVLLAMGGCAWDTPQTSLVPRSDLTRAIMGLYALITWITVVIGAVVLTLVAWIILRFRAGSGDAPLPRQVRGHSALEIAWTLVPALVLLIIAVPTIQVVFRTQAPASPQALEVEVIAKQWWWEFRYPQLGLITANEIHVPAGRPVALKLVGWDVIHSFWVPQVTAKRDVIPGRPNWITFTADTPGTYWGQCAEYCGTSHANMMLRMMVDAPEAFDLWVSTQRAPPTSPPPGPAADGKALYATLACVGCHTIRGESAGAIGPDLTHFGSRTTFAGGLFPNHPQLVAAWMMHPQALKPGAKMPALGLTADQARAIAAYLASLQ